MKSVLFRLAIAILGLSLGWSVVATAQDAGEVIKTLDSAGAIRAVRPAYPAPVSGPLNVRCDVTQTVTASSAYTSGNAVGGKGTCTGMARNTGQGGIIQTAVVRDKAGQNVPYDLILFDADPSATTITDKSAAALNTADLAKVIGVIQFPGVVLGAASTMGVATAAGQGLAYKISTGTTLYFMLVVRGAPTYASTSDVTLSIVSLLD